MPIHEKLFRCVGISHESPERTSEDDVTSQNKEVESAAITEALATTLIFLGFYRCRFVFLRDTNHSHSGASLASSSESEDGGVSSPPRKKLRLSASIMQANGCSQQNGESEAATASTSQRNGACSNTANGDLHEQGERVGFTKAMNQTDQDTVRLIGQHLRSLGLK